MAIKFEKPIIGNPLIIGNTVVSGGVKKGSVTEEKIRKLPHGRTYVKLLQEYIDNKFVKFKNINEMFKHFIKYEATLGTCLGEAETILKEVHKHGVKKGLPKTASKVEAVVCQFLETKCRILPEIAKLKKKGMNRKQVKAFDKLAYNLKNIRTKKIKNYNKHMETVLEKILQKEKIKTDKDKKFSVKNKKQISKYIDKKIGKDNDTAFVIGLTGKKGSHAITAGVKNKKPFFYDNARGFARLDDKKEIFKMLKKDYFKKNATYGGFKTIEFKPHHFSR